jgi:hypothetical protein
VLFQFIQVLYWLALATWFGGVLFIAVAAPVIFRTIHEADPTLPRVLSVNLDKQHSTLLAGSIVANLLSLLVRVQLICAAVVLVTMVAQWAYLDYSNRTYLITAILRGALFLCAVALAIYDWMVVWPRVQRFRQEYIDHADEPDIANAAKDNFDRYQDESVMLLRNIFFLLLGIILFSGDISARVFTVTFNG